MTEIRPAEPADFAGLRALLESCGLYPQSVTPEGSRYWVAWAGAEMVGCIGLELGQGASLIRSTAVVPPFRGTGLGRELAQTALSYAAERGDHAVYLFSSEAGEFWQRFGFVPATVPDIVAALPDVPQVRSGLTRGWIHEEQVWVRRYAGETHN